MTNLPPAASRPTPAFQRGPTQPVAGRGVAIGRPFPLADYPCPEGRPGASKSANRSVRPISPVELQRIVDGFAVEERDQLDRAPTWLEIAFVAALVAAYVLFLYCLNGFLL